MLKVRFGQQPKPAREARALPSSPPSRTRWDNQTPMNTSAVRARFETRSLPNLLVAALGDFTFYVADPISSILSRLQAAHTANIFQE